MDGRLIVFEGLDCSFKETNAKKLKEYITNTGRECVCKSFPTYGNPSAYFVEQFLKGSYGKIEDLSPRTVSIFYMIDMFDYMNKEGLKLLESGTDIILDRYWYSNIYYRIGAAKLDSVRKGEEDYVNPAMMEYITDFIDNLADELDLPSPDIIFKMNNDKELMIETVKKKNSKDDILEANYDYLREVHDAFTEMDFKKYSDCVFGIPVTDENGFRSHEEIYKDIVDRFSEVYHG